MITAIKNMINKKNSFLESASIIFEDSTTTDLKDLIIFGKMDKSFLEADEGLPEEPNKDDTTPTEDPESEPEEGGLMNEPIGDEDERETSLMDTPIGGDESLPEPVGAQTGEPIAFNPDSLLNVAINLKSNTLSDILPIPPDGAEEAIAGTDMMGTRIDSGFGDEPEEPEDPGEGLMGASLDEEEGAGEEIPPVGEAEEGAGILDEPLGESANKADEIKDKLKNAKESDKQTDAQYEEVAKDIKNADPKDTKKVLKDAAEEKKESTLLSMSIGDPIQESVVPDKSLLESNVKDSSLFNEAINFGDDSGAPADGNTPPDEVVATDGSESGSSGGDENSVTNAVKDKVSEVDAPVDAGVDGADDPSKEEIMKKLSGITKSLEDAKTAVINMIK